MIHIKFDTKETALATTFQTSFPNALSDGLILLQVGDIQIYHQSQPDIPLVIIERKTIKDLAASIRDGRYKEQIIRLKSVHQHPTRVFFLIEGCQIGNKHIKNISQMRVTSGCKVNHVDSESLYSAFINIMVRDEIAILETDDLNETCQILNKLLEQVEKKYMEIVGQSVVTGHLNTVETHNFNYSKTIKTNKKHNNNPQVCFINILSQIPGVSSNSAAFIIEHYPTMADLINAYTALDDVKSRSIMLKNIVVKWETGKERKLGPIISNRVYQYLFGISSESDTTTMEGLVESVEGVEGGDENK